MVAGLGVGVGVAGLGVGVGVVVVSEGAGVVTAAGAGVGVGVGVAVCAEAIVGAKNSSMALIGTLPALNQWDKNKVCKSRFIEEW